MDELRLEAFLAVARHGTVKEASRHLHLAQSTVTNRLQSLERRLGVVLVERARGRPHTSLTPEGEDLLKLAERWEEMARDMAGLATRGEASLTVGAPDSVNHYILSPIYSEIAHTNPGLRLKVETANSGELYGKLERREVDVAFVLYDRVVADVKTQPFIDEPMYVATRSAPAPDGAYLDVDVLDPAGEVHIPWGAAYDRWREKTTGGFRGHILVDTAHTITAFLARPGPWAAVPASMVPELRAAHSLNIYRLSGSPPNRVVFAARRMQLGRTALRGYECFEDTVQRLLPLAQPL
jgi:DNA-binding transcriptional LysR family regulator